MPREAAMAYQIVLSRNEYGAFRATPPNLVVHLGDPPQPQGIVFRNISNEAITITLDALLVPRARDHGSPVERPASP